MNSLDGYIKARIGNDQLKRVMQIDYDIKLKNCYHIHLK